MVGGYKIIDFKNREITGGTPFKMEGINEEIRSTSKEIRFTNLKIAGVGEFTTASTSFCKGETLTAFLLCNGGMTVEITADDMVTIRTMD